MPNVHQIQAELQIAIPQQRTAQQPALQPIGRRVNGRARTHYHPTFPSKLRELLSLVPLYNGRNIRPFIVYSLQSSFSTAKLDAISSLLVFASHRVLKSIALALADVVKKCGDFNPGTRTSLGSIFSAHWAPVFAWFRTLRVDQAAGRITLPCDITHVVDLLVGYVDLVTPIDRRRRVRIVLAPYEEVFRSRRRTPQERVGDFVRHLPSVESRELSDNDQCSICLEEYYQPAPPAEGLLAWTLGVLGMAAPASPIKNEEAKRLKCGHIFGADCLLRLLMPQEHDELEHKKCPMCRAPVDI